MSESVIVGAIFGVPVHAYSLCLAVSVLLGLGLMHLCAKKRNLARDAALCLGLWAIPLGVIGARLVYCLVRFEYVFYERGAGFLYSLGEGGFSLLGALLGITLAGVIYARLSRQRIGDVLDCAVPGAALVLAGARFAEAFTTQGVGHYVEEEIFQRFPLAVQTPYGDWVYAVFFWEGLTALTLCYITFRKAYDRRGNSADTVFLFLLVLGASQVFWESLRGDDYLRWGFVKVNQLGGIALLLVSASHFLRERAKATGSALGLYIRAALLLAGVGGCIALEFGLDKSPIPNGLLHLVMAAILGVMVFLALPGRPGLSGSKHEAVATSGK